MEIIRETLETIRRVYRDLRFQIMKTDNESELIAIRKFLSNGMFISDNDIYWEIKKYEVLSEGGGERLKEIWLEHIDIYIAKIQGQYKNLVSDNSKLLLAYQKVMVSNRKSKIENREEVLDITILGQAFYYQLLALKSEIQGHRGSIFEILDEPIISDFDKKFQVAFKQYLEALEEYFHKEDYINFEFALREFLRDGTITRIKPITLVKVLNKKTLGYNIKCVYRYVTNKNLTFEFASFVKNSFLCYEDNTLGKKNGDGNMWDMLREDIKIKRK